MSAQTEYWAEAVSTALNEAGVTALTAEQLAEVAGSVEGWHDNYDMAFYSPPAYERMDAIVEEATAPLKAEVKRLEGVEDVYANSVKRRRGASEVYLEGKSVMYR